MSDTDTVGKAGIDGHSEPLTVHAPSATTVTPLRHRFYCQLSTIATEFSSQGLERDAILTDATFWFGEVHLHVWSGLIDCPGLGANAFANIVGELPSGERKRIGEHRSEAKGSVMYRAAPA